MQLFGDILTCIFLVIGLFFMFVGAVGVWRFPDAYHRLHAMGKCTTLGLLGLLLAVTFHLGFGPHVSFAAIAIKASLTMLFAFIATPVGAHILAKAAHLDELEQWEGTLSDELAQDKANGSPPAPEYRLVSKPEDENPSSGK